MLERMDQNKKADKYWQECRAAGTLKLCQWESRTSVALITTFLKEIVWYNRSVKGVGRGGALMSGKIF